MHSISIRLRRDATPQSRVTVVVPARLFPKAVARNRIRRQIKEAFRKIEGIQHGRYAIAVKGAAVPTGRALEAALLELMGKSDTVSR